MHFVFPAFLFSLLVLALPVLIHLFHFRRFRQVLFSNIRFLKLIQNQKQSKNNLKQLILLILRLLAFTFLVFAFAQPYIPLKDNLIKSGNKAISIYIDNSLSMENMGTNGSLLDNAKKIASEIVKTYDINDKFQVITNDFLSKHQRFYEQDNIQALINEIKPSAFPKKLSSVIQRQTSMLNEAKTSNKIIYVLSDMQKSSSDFDLLFKDSQVVKYFIPLNAPSVNNMAIDTAWLDKPVIRINQLANIKVQITNFSDKAVEDATIVLKINGLHKGLANYTLAPNQTQIVTIPLTVSEPGWNKLSLSITDYPITFDDDYYMSFYVRDKINILCLNNENNANPYIRAVYATDSYFSLTQELLANVNNVDLKNYQFVILNEPVGIEAGMISKLINFVSEGGNLLLIPSSQPKTSPDIYDPLLLNFSMPGFDRIENIEVKLGNINTEHAMFKDIFTNIPKNMVLPGVKRYFSRSANVLSTETELLKLDNNQPFLSGISYLKGNVYVLSVPLNENWTNFPRHAIFLPVMYQLALQYVNSLPLSFELIPNKNIVLSDIATDFKTVYSVKTEGKIFIPDQKIMNGKLNIFINENFDKAGFYSIINNQESPKADPVIAFNNYSKESNTECYSNDELKNLGNQKSINIIKSKNNNSKVIIEKVKSGKPLWKMCLIFSLAFLIAEILLIRYWKI